MKVWSPIIPAMALVAFACSSGDPSAGSDDATGTLTLNLTGTDSRGDQYRLRNADFEITGYPDFETGEGGAGSGFFFTIVTSEDDVDAPVITQRVLPGFYSVFFSSSDWFLERYTPTGAVRVEKAVLLSNRFRNVSVWDGGVSRVTYQFGVDGELIDFRSGDIQIGIGIERPDDNDAGAGGVGGFPEPGPEGGSGF